MELSNESVPTTSAIEDPISFITGGLKFLKYDHSIERVRTTHFIFAADADDFKIDTLSDFGREVIRNYLHIGIVSDACEKLFKQYEVLLVHWPSNIPRSVYEDKSRTHLLNVKKVRTIIFAVPEVMYYNFLKSSSELPMNDAIASTAILADCDEWRLMESKVMASFFHLVNSQFYSDTNMSRTIRKNYTEDYINSNYKRMMYLCCVNYDIGYHVKKMTKRNWARVQRKMMIEDKVLSPSNILDAEVPIGGIYELLVLWYKDPSAVRDIISFLTSINEVKPCLSPLDILEKLKESLVITLFVRKRFSCEICHYVTKSRFSLKRHTRSHTGEKPFHCDLCDRNFAQLSHLNSHIRVHNGVERYKCDFCGRPFAQRVSLKYHQASQHYARGNLDYECYSCHSLFENNAQLKEHVVLHANDKKLQCNTCFRWYVNKADLDKHILNHTLERPFECHICGKKYLTNWALRCHYKIHCEKSFECDYCGKSFRHVILKRKHELCVHNVYSSRVALIEVKPGELGRDVDY